LRNCTTTRRVAGSIPDGVIVIFHLQNLFGSACNINEHQDYFSGSKGGRCTEGTNHLHETIVLKSGKVKFLKTAQLVIGLNRESSRHRLLNHSDTRGRTQNWRSVDQALIGKIRICYTQSQKTAQLLLKLGLKSRMIL
jgi:hypothetical protein